MPYSKSDSQKLVASYEENLKIHRDLQVQYISLGYVSEKGQEFAHHGLLRRLGVIQRAIENIFELCPPENGEVLTDDTLTDIAIQYQALIFNVSGCLDNLAWIWVYEKEVKCPKTGGELPKPKITLFGDKSKILRGSLPEGIKSELVQLNEWHQHLQDYRHSLAHRIPLYVPPYQINGDKALKEHESIEHKISAAMADGAYTNIGDLREEQESLGDFVPVVTHSFGEHAKPAFFHAQALSNWRTVLELAQSFLSELENKKSA